MRFAAAAMPTIDSCVGLSDIDRQSTGGAADWNGAPAQGGQRGTRLGHDQKKSGGSRPHSVVGLPYKSPEAVQNYVGGLRGVVVMSSAISTHG